MRRWTLLMFVLCGFAPVLSCFPPDITTRSNTDETPAPSDEGDDDSDEGTGLLPVSWKLVPISSKKESQPVEFLFIDKRIGRLLVTVNNAGVCDGGILLYAGDGVIFSNAYRFWGEGIPLGVQAPSGYTWQPAPYYYPFVTTFAPATDYFGIINYQNCLSFTEAPPYPPNVFRLSPDFSVETAIPLPDPTVGLPVFFSDLNQDALYALSAVSDTNDAPNSVDLWQWDGVSSWISLLSLREPGDQIGPPIQNPAFIASGDSSDPFVCLAYEEQSASCSRSGGTWSKISFSGVTTGKKITAFAYDAKNKILFAGEDSGKVLASRDFQTWEIWGTGTLGTGIAKELVFSPDLQLLLAVTDQAEVYGSVQGGGWDSLLGSTAGTLQIQSIDHLVYHPPDKRFYAVLSYQDTSAASDSTNPFPWESLAFFALSK